MRNVRTGRLIPALFAAGAVAAAAAVPATALPQHNAGAQGGPTVNDVNRHLVALQRIADRNDGTRASGTPGYQASVDYVAKALRRAGYEVSTPEFKYTKYQLDSVSLDVGGSAVETDALEYSPATPENGIQAPLAVTPVDDSTGCQAADYEGADVTDTIALIKRGACTFAKKQRIASEQGASAAIIYNNAEGPVNGTLGGADAGVIPTVGVDEKTGAELVDKKGTTAQLNLRANFNEITTENVIAETRTGREDNVVMAGAHLDSVDAGAGINDNGTGSAGLLETALELGGEPDVNNAVRFAWWGAEESGLIGSTKYVNGLSFQQQLDIAMYLNFDMIGSPNAGYFSYDGDDSDGVGAGPGPHGSAQIEQDFAEAMKRQGVEIEGTDFNGRSDYGQFIAKGIPAGGLFTGAGGIKTEEQAAKWGGKAGVAYDPNYHTADDDLDNVDCGALIRNTRAISEVVGHYARTTEEVNGMQSRQQRAQLRRAAMAEPMALNNSARESHGHSCQLPLK